MIKRFITYSLLLALFSACGTKVDAPQAEESEWDGVPTLRASFAPDSIAIGDHVTLTIDVDVDVMQQVGFPEFEMDRDSSAIELVSASTLDTVEINGRRKRLRRDYIFTSFEEGLYNLGRTAVIYTSKSGVDTLRADDSLRLMVTTFLIDTTSHSPFDIKPIRNTPFQFREISGYTMWGVVALIALAIIAYFVLRLLAYLGRPVMGLFKPAPPVAPDVAAFAALEELRGEQLWQGGDYKGYYSRLTDILRRYLWGRYSVSAMEMTTDEIFEAIRSLELPSQCEMELRDLLLDADLVKFAKAEFAGSMNELYFDSAKRFVEQTRELLPEEIEEEEDDE